MAIPDYQACMLPLLRFASDGKEHQLKDAIKKLAQEFHLMTLYWTSTVRKQNNKSIQKSIKGHPIVPFVTPQPSAKLLSV